MSISSVLFEQGGWIYFIRKAGYNSVLCKSRLDGSKYCIIAADIDKFIEIKNGYLYYINFDSSLVKVRMDGSNLQELCEDVEEVLQVQEDRIVFVSLDDKIKVSGFENMTAKAVKSIYAVDFSGSGIMKLAYNVKSAKLYDENTVYYVAEQSGKKTAQGEKKPDNLLRLRLSPYMTENLLVMDVPLEEQKDMSKATIALIVMGVAFFIAFIGLMAGAPGLFLFATLVAIVALSVGLIIKYNSKYKNEMISAIDGLFKPESSEAMKKINKYMKDFIDKLSK